MAAEYSESQRVEDIARKLIPMYHQHLSKAKIAYVMKERPPEKPGQKMTPPRMGKKKAYGKATAVNPLWNCISGFDFVLEVDEVYWDILDLDGQEALVDHELCHMVMDEKGWYLKDHDVEAFIAEVQRHGAWRGGMAEFAEAVQLHLPLEGTGGQAAAPAVH